jgi:hypothetical protein
VLCCTALQGVCPANPCQGLPCIYCPCPHRYILAVWHPTPLRSTYNPGHRTPWALLWRQLPSIRQEPVGPHYSTRPSQPGCHGVHCIGTTGRVRAHGAGAVASAAPDSPAARPWQITVGHTETDTPVKHCSHSSVLMASAEMAGFQGFGHLAAAPLVSVPLARTDL